ncbi:VOC family protein [Pacificimonas sp. ICDLI1SI03]
MQSVHLSHFGIFVRDIDAMERFYADTFDMVVTDRGMGKTFKNSLVFMTGDPEQHHQLVLSSGRAPDGPSTIMQISFKVHSLADLRLHRDRALANGAQNMVGLNHGNAWSIYLDDIEGNKIEIYLDTPYHVPQPCGVPLDIDQSEETLMTETKILIESLPGNKPRDAFVQTLRETFGTKT